MLNLMTIKKSFSQCSEYEPNDYTNPGSCEDLWFLDDNDDDYNISLYDGCSAEIIFDLYNDPNMAAGIMVDTMVIELYTYYNDTKTEIMYDPRVDYFDLAYDYDSDKYKDFGFVQDPTYDERFYFYESETSLPLDTLLDFTAKQPLVDSNDLFIVLMDDLSVGDCVTLIYDIKIVTDADATCLYEGVIDFQVPSEQVCATVQNGFPPMDSDCHETPFDSNINIESEEGCAIADAEMEDGEFCFRAGEGDCINLYLEECGVPEDCLTTADNDLISNYVNPPYTLPSNPYFFIVGDADRDGDVDYADWLLNTSPNINNQNEGEYVAECVLILDPGEETAEVERENLGLRLCSPYPEEIELISLMIGDIDGDCACDENFSYPSSPSAGNEEVLSSSMQHPIRLNGVDVINRGNKLNIYIKENSNIYNSTSVRLITISGQVVGLYTQFPSDNFLSFNLFENYTGLYILQFISKEETHNYYIPSMR